jgi:polysaccharide export outer membrane protein
VYKRQVYGNRKGIVLIREENGQREHVRLDLTTRDIFNSPYYYMHRNDVLYIEPVAARVTSTDRIYQLTPLIVSIVTAMSLIFVRLK